VRAGKSCLAASAALFERYDGAPMKLFGTTTSPFVRRVRVVAAELGCAVERIDTASEEGQAALRAVTPIRKVPIAVVDGRTIFDSRVIIDWLTTTRGFAGLTPPSDRWRDANLLNAIDAAVDSAIQVFYLRRDGIAIEGNAFAQRQTDRIEAIFAWLGGELNAAGDSFGSGLGVAEISLIAGLDWMDFRKTFATENVPQLSKLRTAWAERPSLVSTRPQ
jgi:glutathione S-transferase